MQPLSPAAGILTGDIRSAWDDLKTAISGPIEQFAWWQSCAENLPGVGRVRPFLVSANGTFLAIAPLALRPGPLPRLELIGIRQLHEPMDFIYSNRQALATLCDQLAQQKVPLDLQRVPRHSPLIGQLQRAFKGRGLLRVSATTPYPFLALDASWAAPESHFNAGRRSDFRRAMRNAEKVGSVRFEVVIPEASTLDGLLAEAYATELQGWKGRRGSAVVIDPIRVDFYRRYFHECMAQGMLRLAFMRIDSKAIAMQIGVVVNNRLWLLKIGYNDAHARLSPGSLLMLEVVRHAAQTGIESIEFLGTVEPWTQTWTQAEHECVHIRGYPTGFLSCAVFVVDALKWAAAQVARRWQDVRAKLRSFAKARLAAVSRYLSRAYIAGPELGDALTAFDRLARNGQAGTIGYFNPARQPADEIANVDRQVLAALGMARHAGYVSIKVPPLGFDVALVEEIASLAEAVGVGIHFDSHAIETTDATFACIEAALRHTSRIGCTLPGRWPRSLRDAERAIDLKLRVRVVKGQWADPAHPEVDSGAGFLQVVDTLAGRAQAVAVATHDPVLAREALGRLLAAGTTCELEQLFGLPMRAVSAVARNMNVPVRVYIPFGAAWLPYALTQLVNNPKILWWLLKDAGAAAGQRIGRKQ